MRMSIVLLALVLAVGCNLSSSSSTPAPFEYKATAAWNAQNTPNVTSMTIDGQAFASGQVFSLDMTFPSYDDARASFVPKNVTITTTTETLQFQIDLGACEDLVPSMVDAPLIMETDRFVTDPSVRQSPSPSVDFFIDCGSCTGKTRQTAYCS